MANTRPNDISCFVGNIPGVSFGEGERKLKLALFRQGNAVGLGHKLNGL